MGMRRLIRGLGLGVVPLALAFLVRLPAVDAADDPVAEAATPPLAEADGGSTPDGAAPDPAEVRALIDGVTDPALREQMLHELQQMEASGGLPQTTGDLPAPQQGNASDQGQGAGAQASPMDGLPGGEGQGLVAGPTTGGQGDPGRQAAFEAVQQDPRMESIRQQFESGQINEGTARDQMFEVLRDHGVTPDSGREWDPREGTGQDGEMGAGREWGMERGEGMEHMSPEAREQMERMFGEHDAERGGMEFERGSMTDPREMEIYREAPEQYREAPEQYRDYEAPARGFEAPSYEPEREYEAPPEPQ